MDNLHPWQQSYQCFSPSTSPSLFATPISLTCSPRKKPFSRVTVLAPVLYSVTRFSSFNSLFDRDFPIRFYLHLGFKSMMDTRKRGRPDFKTNGFGGFKKSKQGHLFLLISRFSQLISLTGIWAFHVVWFSFGVLLICLCFKYVFNFLSIYAS